MTRLGIRQVRRLAALSGIGLCQVVPDDVTRSLCLRGLMLGTAPDGDGMVVVTPAGLRALADALDAGRMDWKPDWDAIRAKREAAR
jgi:hypothetical protein